MHINIQFLVSYFNKKFEYGVFNAELTKHFRLMKHQKGEFKRWQNIVTKKSQL